MLHRVFKRIGLQLIGRNLQFKREYHRSDMLSLRARIIYTTRWHNRKKEMQIIRNQILLFEMMMILLIGFDYKIQKHYEFYLYEYL